ncbi:MAG: phosphatidylinositol alpha-1,6-mannosyltransferase [Zhongshania sp.]|jgi:phosphatidylinositol alpha-1,6-mannosyltransferase
MPSYNIIISTQNYPPTAGGIQNYMHGLANALHQLGNTVHVICDAPTADRQAQFDSSLPFSIERFGGPKVLRRYRKARKLLSHLKKTDHAILICDSWKSLELLNTEKLTHISCVCIAHGMEFPAKLQRKKQQRIANTLSRAQVILANSEFTAQRVKAYAPDFSRVHVLHPGVTQPFQPSAKDLAAAENWCGEHHPLLITVGRLEARKGQDKVIAAIPKLLCEHPELGYLVVGSGPIHGDLIASAEALGVSNNVKFCGRANDGERTALLQKADLFAMPCRAVGDSVEGFGIVYIEAAMLGLPSLAGKVGGAGDAVIDDHTGILCNGESDEEIYLSIKRMISDSEALKAMGQRAQHRAKSELQWHQIAQKLLNYTIEKPTAT